MLVSHRVRLRPVGSPKQAASPYLGACSISAMKTNIFLLLLDILDTVIRSGPWEIISMVLDTMTRPGP